MNNQPYWPITSKTLPFLFLLVIILKRKNFIKIKTNSMKRLVRILILFVSALTGTKFFFVAVDKLPLIGRG